MRVETDVNGTSHGVGQPVTPSERYTGIRSGTSISPTDGATGTRSADVTVETPNKRYNTMVFMSLFVIKFIQ